MPLLDVTDILSDPDFVDLTPVCIRQDQVAAPGGRVTNVQTSTPFTGVFTMDRGSILNRMAEGSYVSGSILVYTPFQLRMSGASVDADLIDWHGERYTVVNRGDYTAYGSGFVWAVGEPVKLSG